MVHNDIQTLFAESLNELKLTEKQKAVLNASLKLFSEKGFDRTSTSDIAQLAGVSEGTVYKQFKTKEGILTAIIGPFIQQVMPKAATEFTNEVTHTSYPSFGEFLHAIIKDRTVFALNSMPQLRIILHEVITNQAIATGFSHLFENLIVGPLGQTLKHYQEEKQLVDWPLDRIIRYVATTVMGYVLPAALLHGSVDIEHASREATEFLLKGLKPA